MSRAPFEASRADGRSDKQVVYDLVEGADPDTLFGYTALKDALEDGLDDPIERGRVYRAVAAANRVLLREQRRFLTNVKGSGYRVARSDEHVPYSLLRKERAEVQLGRGVEILRNVRWDELQAAERQLAEGTLLVLDGFHRALKSSERRHARQEDAIGSLARRVEKLETEVP